MADIINRLSIVVADRQSVMRVGIRTLLEEQPDWQVVSEADDGRQAVEQAKQHKPILIVLDIDLPILNGVDATRLITTESPMTRIVVFTTTESEDVAQQAVHAGARAYVLKTDRGRDLVVACVTVLRDEVYIAPKVARLVLDEYVGVNPQREKTTHGLTGRQREVTQLIAEGHSTKAIADRLSISLKTAETHRSNIMRKLNCHSVNELIRFAVCNLSVNLNISRSRS